MFFFVIPTSLISCIKTWTGVVGCSINSMFVIAHENPTTNNIALYEAISLCIHIENDSDMNLHSIHTFLGTCICSWGQLCLELTGDGTRGGGKGGSRVCWPSPLRRSRVYGQLRQLVRWISSNISAMIGITKWVLIGWRRIRKWLQQRFSKTSNAFSSLIATGWIDWTQTVPRRLTNGRSFAWRQWTVYWGVLPCTVNVRYYPLTRGQVYCKNARFNHQENLQRKESF